MTRAISLALTAVHALVPPAAAHGEHHDPRLQRELDAAVAGFHGQVGVYVRHLRNKVDRPFGREGIQTLRGAGSRLAVDGG